MRNKWIAIAGILGGLGVALGAFGAHGLKARLSPDALAIYEVGVRYHMYHAIAMLAVALYASEKSNWRRYSRACAAWLIGIVVFSGSLYALALTNIRWLGAVTPFGGVAFIVGWSLTIFAARDTQHRNGD